jgi:pyruvate kinase
MPSPGVSLYIAPMRHTKIVATAGPASNDRQTIEALIAAGVDVFRLNFSHGTHESHAQTFARVREAAVESGRHIAIMQDLSGPKIRTGTLVGGAAISLEPGDELRLAEGEGPGGPGLVFTPFGQLIRSARIGDRLLLADGRIELRVVKASPSELTTVVVHGGRLGEHKGINAPGVPLATSALTAKDIDDLRFGLDLGVHFVALSFVQTPEDVSRTREQMTAHGRVVPVIAKIERPAAVENLAGILAVAQGVMVARGDLGLEMPLEQLPRVQKEIMRCARAAGRPVILATQVLESMCSEPRPTRAEVSDAANAVDEGADAIMLAGETAIGAHPVRAVETLDAIIRDAERVPPATRVHPDADPIFSRHGRALCEAAVTLATAGEADAIVAVTREGKTARILSSLRPSAPIYSASASEDVSGALALLWGVVPVVTPEREVERLEAVLLERKLMPAGSMVVFINVSPELNRPDINFVNFQRIG